MFQTLKSTALIAATLGLLGTASLIAAEQKAVVKVYGMDCPACANGVAGSLKSLKGVKSADVSVKDGQATVTYDDSQVSLEQVKKRIEMSGFSTTPPKKTPKG